MSSAVLAEREIPEFVVRNRSQFADTLHRRDGQSDEIRPACPVRQTEKEYTGVPAEAYVGHYKLCGNPECFGGEWR